MDEMHCYEKLLLEAILLFYSFHFLDILVLSFTFYESEGWWEYALWLELSYDNKFAFSNDALYAKLICSWPFIAQMHSNVILTSPLFHSSGSVSTFLPLIQKKTNMKITHRPFPQGTHVLLRNRVILRGISGFISWEQENGYIPNEEIGELCTLGGKGKEISTGRKEQKSRF